MLLLSGEALRNSSVESREISKSASGNTVLPSSNEMFNCPNPELVLVYGSYLIGAYSFWKVASSQAARISASGHRKASQLESDRSKRNRRKLQLGTQETIGRQFPHLHQSLLKLIGKARFEDDPGLEQIRAVIVEGIWPKGANRDMISHMVPILISQLKHLPILPKVAEWGMVATSDPEHEAAEMCDFILAQIDRLPDHLLFGMAEVGAGTQDELLSMRYVHTVNFQQAAAGPEVKMMIATVHGNAVSLPAIRSAKEDGYLIEVDDVNRINDSFLIHNKGRNLGVAVGCRLQILIDPLLGV